MSATLLLRSFEHSSPGTPQAMGTAVADLCDAHFGAVQDGRVRALDPGLRQYGGATVCQGQAVTLRVFEDNSLVREELEKDGSGKILVVDGGGSLRCALLGGNLASLAARNNWGGVLVYGCVRDVAELKIPPVDIRALGSNPIKSRKRGSGERDVAVAVGGVRIAPGEWVYGDLDGVIVSDAELRMGTA